MHSEHAVEVAQVVRIVRARVVMVVLVLVQLHTEILEWALLVVMKENYMRGVFSFLFCSHTQTQQHFSHSPDRDQLWQVSGEANAPPL